MQEIIQCKACGKYIEGEWTLYNGHCNSKDDIGEVTKCTPTETDVGVSCMAGIISKFSKKKSQGAKNYFLRYCFIAFKDGRTS